MNIPNKITTIRVFLLLFAIILFYRGKILLGTIFFVLNLLGDIADGYFARKLSQETEFGADFDAMVDFAGYFFVLFVSWNYFSDIILDHSLLFIVVILISITPFVFSLLKFKKLFTFHLISSKVAALVVYISFVFALLEKTTLRFSLPILAMILIVNTLERNIIIARLSPKTKRNKILSVLDVLRKK